MDSSKSPETFRNLPSLNVCGEPATSVTQQDSEARKLNNARYNLLKKYIKQSQKEGLSLSAALKSWRTKAEFFSPTVKACFQLLSEMGQPYDKIMSDVLEILNSKFLVQVEKLPNMENMSAVGLRGTMMQLLEDASRFLHLPFLRSGSVSLLVKQLGGLDVDVFKCSFFMDLVEQSPFADNSLLTMLFFSTSLTRADSRQQCSTPQDLGLIRLWARVVSNILHAAFQKDNFELLHFCRYTSSLQFRCLLWPVVGDWLIDEILKLLIPACLEIHSIHIEGTSRLNGGAQESPCLSQEGSLLQLTVIVSKSSFCYDVFLSTTECFYATYSQRGMFGEYLCNLLTAPFSSVGSHGFYNALRDRIPRSAVDRCRIQEVLGLEYLFPSLRVAVLRQLALLYGSSCPSKMDPVAYKFINLMDHLCNVTRRGARNNDTCPDDYPTPPITHSAPSAFCFTRTSTYSKNFESSIDSLRYFTIKNLNDLLTISFVLCHPPYIQLLTELFLELQITEQQTVLGTWSSSPKATEFLLGLLTLGVSFPALHASLTSLKGSPYSFTEREGQKNIEDTVDTFGVMLCPKRRRLSVQHELDFQDACELSLEMVTAQLRVGAKPATAVNINVKTSTSLLRNVRRCVVRLRPATVQFLSVLKTLLRFNSNDPSFTPHVSLRHKRESETASSSRSLLCNLTDFEPLKRVSDSSHNKSHSSMFVDAFQSVFKCCSVSFCIKKQGNRLEKRCNDTNHAVHRKKRFFLDFRLLMIIVIGLLGCAQRFPHLNDTIVRGIEAVGAEFLAEKQYPLFYAAYVTSTVAVTQSAIRCEDGPQDLEALRLQLAFNFFVLPSHATEHMEKLFNRNDSDDRSKDKAVPTVPSSTWIRIHCALIILTKLIEKQKSLRCKHDSQLFMCNRPQDVPTGNQLRFLKVAYRYLEVIRHMSLTGIQLSFVLQLIKLLHITFISLGLSVTADNQLIL